MTQQEYENKIKELENELEQLKAAKIEAEQPKRWKPEYDEPYWYVGTDGSIYGLNWDNDPVDDWRYLIGNCFKSEEEAEEYKKQIEYTARYKNYIEEHSEPLDWTDEEQKKYYAYFGVGVDGVAVDWGWSNVYQGTTYASSPEIIWGAIKEIGEDNFKKYVLGVK